MNILIALNQKYVPHAKVMLASLRDHNKRDEIIVYLLYKNLDDVILKELTDFLSGTYGIRLEPIRIESTPFDHCKLHGHFSIEVVFRLMLLEVLPSELDRVLWLDSDIVINGSISKLYNIEFKDEVAAVCKGRGDTIKIYNERLHLPNEYDYFNSGVILFNLTVLREKKLLDTFKGIIEKYGDILTFLDQDILNIAFADEKLIYLDPVRFNYQVDRLFSMSRKEYKHFLETCSVIHYASRAKPWNVAYNRGLEKKYWKYALQQGRRKEYIRFCFMLKPKSKMIYLRVKHNFVKGKR